MKARIIAVILGVLILVFTNIFVFKIPRLEWWRYALGYLLCSFGYAFCFYGSSDTIANEVDKDVQG